MRRPRSTPTANRRERHHDGRIRGLPEVQYGFKLLCYSDGLGERRDRPRYLELDVTAKRVDIDVNAGGGDRVQFEHDAPGRNPSSMHVQPNAWDRGDVASPETMIHGHLDLPKWLTDRKCFETNETTGKCEDWETDSERQRRLKPYVNEILRLGDEFAFPPAAWWSVIGID